MHQNIGLVTKDFSAKGAPDIATLIKVANAINMQMQQDVAGFWKVDVTVHAYPSVKSMPPATWPVFIESVIDDPEALGYHTDENHQPFALIKFDKGWTVTASHEIIEMAVDPWGSRLTHMAVQRSAFPHTQWPVAGVLALVEACDPCEAFTYSVADVMVSDFVLPVYYSGVTTRYGDFLHKLAPGDIAQGGYLSYIDLAKNEWQQLTNFGGLEVSDLGPVGMSQQLREWSDRNARAKRSNYGA